eukprot:jgi/Tetstr1/444075/TSEL_003315.t1
MEGAPVSGLPRRCKEGAERTFVVREHNKPYKLKARVAGSSGWDGADCELRLVDVTRHDDPAEELPEQVKGDLRARGHVIRRDSQLDRELKKLPLSHAEEVEAWLRQMLARLGARDAGYEARYVVINEAANWMDKKLLAPLLEANGRDPGHSGPAGHLRSLLFDAKVDGELLRPERMALYQEYAQDRNNIKHNPGCEASTAVALGWLGMIGNRLLHDCCGTDEAIRERVRACLESGTASAVEPAAPVRIDPCKHFVGRRWLFDHIGSLLSPDADTLAPPAALLLAPGGWGKSAFMDELCVTGGLRLGAQYSVVAWHAIKHDELSSTCTPAALVQHLASVLEDRLVPYAKLRSRQDIRDLFDEKQLGNDGGWTSLLKGVLAPLADLKLEGEALERALGGQGRCVGVIVVDGLDEAVASHYRSSGVLQLVAKMGLYLQGDHIPWLRLVCSSRPGINSVERYISPGVFHFYEIKTIMSEDSAKQDLVDYVEEECSSPSFPAGRLDTDERAALVERAAYSFQWLRHALLHIKRQRSWEAGGVATLPAGGVGGIPNMYLARFESEFPRADDCFASLRPTFEVILAAMRPLTVSTLHQVVRLSRETSLVEDSPDGFRAEVLDKITGFLSLSGPADNPVVAIQHESLASWLQGDTLRRSAGGYGCRKANGHTLLGAWMLCGMEATPEVVAGDKETLDLSRTVTPWYCPGDDYISHDPVQRLHETFVHLVGSHIHGGSPARIQSLFSVPGRNVALNTTGEMGVTALHFAALLGHVEVVELLLRGVEGGPAADISCTDMLGKTALHFAALLGHVEVVELLLRGVEGGPAADISCTDKNSMTALHFAAQGCHAEVVELLLRGVEGGPAADISCTDEDGMTALHWAARKGHAQMVVEQLLRGVEGGTAADISCADEDGMTALHWAAQGGHVAVAKLLLRGVAGGPVADISCKDKDGMAALHVAALIGHAGVVELLLRGVEGSPAADISCPENNGRTALHCAARKGHAEVVELLLRGGEGGPVADISCKDRDGRTALHCAAQRGHAAVVALLLRGVEGGPAAEISCVDKYGKTALHQAASEGHAAVVALLLRGVEGGPAADISCTDKNSMTALHHAAQWDHMKVVELLLRGAEGGPAADISRATNQGMPALHCAALNSHAEVVEQLLRGGEGGPVADISCKDRDGRTALHCAAQRGHAAVVALLLRGVEGGPAADISCADKNGMTALHQAAFGDHAAVVALLLRGGEGGPVADISCKDRDGRTALHCAAQRGHAAVVALLLRGVEGGPAADISCADEDGKTALHWAAQGGHAAVAKLLLRGVAGGPVADISCKDKDGMAALHVAALIGHAEVVEQLLRGVEGGPAADITCQDKEGRTALHWAALRGHAAVVELLLRGVAGGPAADISLPDKRGMTALHHAAQWDHMKVVELLLRGVEGGPAADISSTAKNGWTALHCAAQRGHAGVVELLLRGAEGGPEADISCQDHNGMTALQLAETGQHQAASLLLSQHRAGLAGSADNGVVTPFPIVVDGAATRTDSRVNDSATWWDGSALAPTSPGGWMLVASLAGVGLLAVAWLAVQQPRSRR